MLHRLFLCLSVLSIAAGTAIAQPVVSNVTASQTPGTRLVAIGYTLSHPQSLPCTVTLQASRDNGVTWESVTSGSGAVGAGIASTSSGTAKTITWTVGNDWPAQLFSQVKVRIAADDGSGGSTVPAGFARIPGGTFVMGDAGAAASEMPTHQVTLPSFYMGKTEVTWAEWVAVRDWALAHGYTDLAVGAGKAPDHPAQSVSWYDAIKWLNAKSEKEGLMPVYYTNDAQSVIYRTGSVDVTNAQVNWGANGYRLPTEAEWEYAARGGLAGRRFPWGDTITHEQANYTSSTTYPYDVSPTRGTHPTYTTGSQPYTSPVGSFAANGYGLQDMAGNVYEWCWDWVGNYDSTAVTSPLGPASGTIRVNRGGSWEDESYFARVTRRNAFVGPTTRDSVHGFRQVRSIVSEMVPIPAGTFVMGDVLDGYTDAPPHEVTLSAYYMATTEVTLAEWTAVRDWAVTYVYPDLVLNCTD